MLLTSAKVPNDLEIYPTFNVDYNNMTEDMHIKAKYFSLDSFYYGVYLVFRNENNEAQGAISVTKNEDTAY